MKNVTFFLKSKDSNALAKIVSFVSDLFPNVLMWSDFLEAHGHDDVFVCCETQKESIAVRRNSVDGVSAGDILDSFGPDGRTPRTHIVTSILGDWVEILDLKGLGTEEETLNTARNRLTKG